MLCVWLPLNGDLHNQGLSNITVTNNGATVNTSGKIGSCYSFNGSNQKITGTFSSSISSAIGSLACWVKFNSLPSSSTWFNLMQLGATGGFAACRLGMYVEYGTGINISINGSSTGANYKAYSFSTGTWYHICSVYDGTKVKLYINGVEQLNKTASVGSYTTAANMLFIGGTSSYYLNGYVDDCRYYDHALSAKEVEEIAKGLVLHYKLDNNGLGGENLALSTASKIVTATATGTDVSAVTTLDYGLLTNWSRIRGQTITISCDIELINAVNTTGVSNYRVGIEPALKFTDNTTGYYGIWIGLNSTPKTISQRYTKSYTLPDKDVQSVLQNGMYIQHLTNGSATIKNIKVELGSVATRWSPAPADLGLDTSIVYDCSGYNNNGQIVGTLTTTADTPKYEVSNVFDGNTSCIKFPFNTIVPHNIFTFNLWFKKDALGTKYYETLVGGLSGFEMDTRSGAATTLSLYMASKRGGNVFSPFSFGQWYMVTMVRDGTNELYYVNGELVKTITAQSMPTGQYWLGAWASNTGQNYYGKMSDFRIYTTPLTGTQIKELYNTSMSIDDEGNMYVRELVEL